MTLSPEEWHQRFRQQARWTHELRAHAYRQAGLDHAGRVIEVGCGTGAVLADFLGRAGLTSHGLDLSEVHLGQARRRLPGSILVKGDAHHLPYAGGVFDLALCHFLLLWVADPGRVVAEMARLVRSGGAVLLLAEPDYGGRVDHPEEMARLGALQREALRLQGAQPQMGRRLAGLLRQAGLEKVVSGVLGGSWTGPADPVELAQEWKVLRADLAGTLSEGELDALQELDELARARGERVLFVPTFYAWGWKDQD
jgi:SAM-dependent methyltransferase